jgi:hypothetical protein
MQSHHVAHDEYLGVTRQTTVEIDLDAARVVDFGVALGGQLGSER